MPPYQLAGLVLLLMWGIQAELRFGAKARAMAPGASDKNSTMVLSVAAVVPMIGLILSIKHLLPVPLPAMPAFAWVGVVAGAMGFFLRLWAVLVMRERYTRTLLVQDQQSIVRHGPYRFVRHPGYLGSLLCLNGIGVASGNAITAIASVVITCAAYGYRIHVEDAMLIGAFGDSYEEYRRSTGALIPWFARKAAR